MLERREAEIRAKVRALSLNPCLFRGVSPWMQAEWHERRVREKEERAQQEQLRQLQQQQGAFSDGTPSFDADSHALQLSVVPWLSASMRLGVF